MARPSVVACLPCPRLELAYRQKCGDGYRERTGRSGAGRVACSAAAGPRAAPCAQSECSPPRTRPSARWLVLRAQRSPDEASMLEQRALASLRFVFNDDTVAESALAEIKTQCASSDEEEHADEEAVRRAAQRCSSPMSPHGSCKGLDRWRRAWRSRWEPTQRSRGSSAPTARGRPPRVVSIWEASPHRSQS